MKFLRLSVLFGLLLIGDRTFAADDDDKSIMVAVTVTSSFDSTKPQDDLSAQIDWRIPVAKWHTTPHWKPETEPVPLDAEGAVEAAKRWITAQPWADQFGDIDTIELICWGDSIRPSPEAGLWYYKINFHFKKEPEDKSSPKPTPTTQLDLRPKSVVLLLDGTIIEPTISKPVRRGDQ